MTWLRMFVRRVAASFATSRRRSDAEADLEAELEAHLAMATDENLRRGMTPDAARRDALLRSGGVESAKEAYRDRRGVPWVENAARDVRWGSRSLLRSPGLALAVILTLTLGIGATTVMFSVVNGILIDPLPFGNSDRLLWTVNRGTRPYDAMSPLDMRDWARLIPSLETVGSWTPSSATLDDGTTPEHVDIAEVTDNWFSMLGVRPQLGRGFVRGEQGQQAPTVVVIGDGLWRSNFGADPHVVGRVVHVNGAPYTVVGVAPAGFDFPDHAEMWRPVALVPQVWASRGGRVFRGPIALLKPGATLAIARREARVAAAQMRQNDPVNEAGLSFDLESLHDQLVGNTRRPLIILLAAVGVLLLIACVNVATLLLVRASARSTEIGVRLALGASRGRVAFQLLVESSLLAAAGGVLGILSAIVGVRAIVGMGIGNLPLLANVRLEPHVLGFSLAVTIVAGLTFGVGPAIRSSRTDIVGSLRPGGRGMSATRSGARLREALVAAQVALGVPLLIAAMLLATSFARLVSTDTGFRADGITRFDVVLPSCGTAWLPDVTCSRVSGTHYTRPDEIRRFTRELLDRLRRMPGTVAASAGMGAPFSAWAKNQGGLAIYGVTPPREVNPVEVKYIAPGYFAALGASIVRGRDFNRSDYHGRDDYCSTAAIVSQGAVHAYFGALLPLNARLTGFCDSTTAVVGVASDIKTESLAGAPEPALYQSLDETPVGQFTVLIRSTSDPATVMSAARLTVASLDRSVPLFRMETMRESVQRVAAPALLAARVVGGFALAALLLSIIGITGLIGHVVRERRRELGIRMALGAQPWQVTLLALRGGALAVVYGMVPGTLIALVASRGFGSLLYGVAPTDAATYAIACGTLAVVALLACWIPARGAARIDPTLAIREE